MKVINLNPTIFTETDLVEGCVEGNRLAQKALYDKYSSKMFAICLRYAPDYHTAEDLLQEGFVKIYYNIYKYNGTGSFEGWMKRVFINHAIEQLRKADKLTTSEETIIAPELLDASSAINKLNMDDLLRLVQSLPTGYRTVFNLYVIEGFSHKEIADMLNIIEGTSKSQLARAKMMLQKMINRH